jgi:hypothetical protein
MPTDCNAFETLDQTSSSERSNLPKPNVTSASTVGITTYQTIKKRSKRLEFSIPGLKIANINLTGENQ